MPQEKISVRFAFLTFCLFIFVKSMPLFKMHIHINKNGRDSFESAFGNAISGQIVLK